MSYTRGAIYIWSSDCSTHVWVANPEPDLSYAESGWGASWAEEGRHLNGVCVPQDVLDELVVMRYAEMTDAERGAATQRALERWRGNGGCFALAEQAGIPPL
jgi:hypothetical protein